MYFPSAQIDVRSVGTTTYQVDFVFVGTFRRYASCCVLRRYNSSSLQCAYGSRAKSTPPPLASVFSHHTWLQIIITVSTSMVAWAVLGGCVPSPSFHQTSCARLARIGGLSGFRGQGSGDIQQEQRGASCIDRRRKQGGSV